MTEKFDAEAHADHMARLMRVPMLPEWRATIVAHLIATSTAAERVMSFALDDHVEPAPVFEP